MSTRACFCESNVPSDGTGIQVLLNSATAWKCENTFKIREDTESEPRGVIKKVSSVTLQLAIANFKDLPVKWPPKEQSPLCEIRLFDYAGLIFIYISN